MTRETIVYWSGGEKYLYTVALTEAARVREHRKAKKSGHDGYLSGIHYLPARERVLVYFREKPSHSEILHRRKNGLLYARWYWIKESDDGYEDNVLS